MVNPIMSSIKQSHGGVCGANDMCLLIFDDDDGESITIDENKEEADNSIDQRKKKKIGLLNKWKSNHRRSTASIIRTDQSPAKASGAAKMSTSLPTINESRNDVEDGLMIPDDMSESSFNVLKRYMGCSPIPYGSKRPVVTTRDRDDRDIRVDASQKEEDPDIKSTQPPSLPLTQTRDDIEDDSTSEASSLDVLMIYISCTPISYRDHKQHSTTIISSDQVNENSRDEISTNLSHIYGSCEIDDSNSLLPDNDYDEEESIDVTLEQRHELLVEVIKEMIANSNDHAERNVDTSTRREEEECQKIERAISDDDQQEEDTEMKSVLKMSSPRKILFKRLFANRSRQTNKQTNKSR